MLTRILSHRAWRPAVLFPLVCLVLAACNQSQTDATIQPPPNIGFAWNAPTNVALKASGYEAREYFFQGTAHAYVTDQPLQTDGIWNVQASGETAHYKSRMIVYRPVEAARFNGTVIVEWMNVSGGIDTPTEWIMLHTELMRQGYAYVGVSAQYIGVEGGPNALPSQLPLCLAVKCVLPPRYRTLSHPGDSFSYDIFRKAAQLVRHPAELNPLGTLTPQYLIAAGQSQSAHRLVTFANAFGLETADLFDGYFIHSRLGAGIPELGGGGSAPLSQPPQIEIQPPAAVLIRPDLPVPVLNLQTETDQVGLLAHLSRQPDSPQFRLWEVAGSAHADLYVSNIGLSDDGQDIRAAGIRITRRPSPLLTGCPDAINSGPPHHFVAKAAMRALDQWIKNGITPPSFPRLSMNAAGDGYEEDAYGNALGGVRNPFVEVPIARLSGLNSAPHSGKGLCYLFGTTSMLDADTLAALYPTHEDYIAAMMTAVDAAIQQGALLAEDAALIISAADAANIPLVGNLE